jgi:hypothetical protein
MLIGRGTEPIQRVVSFVTPSAVGPPAKEPPADGIRPAALLPDSSDHIGQKRVTPRVRGTRDT